MKLFKISLLVSFITLLQAFITAGETIQGDTDNVMLISIDGYIITLHNTVLLCSKMLRCALWGFQQLCQTAVVVTVLPSGVLSLFPI